MNTKRMKFLVIIVALLIFLSITLTVMAQSTDGKVTSQLESSDILSNSSFVTNFTSADINYLPILFKDYTPCTTIPTLLSPPDGDDIYTLNPFFTWNNGVDPNATESVIQYAEDDNFHQESYLTTSYYLPGIYKIRFPWNLEPGTTYYWRVRLTCKNTQGLYSEVWSFTTSATGTILPAPTLISPANGSTIPSTLATLQWSPVVGALEYGVYWKKIGQQITYIMRVSGTQANIQVTPNSSYLWWIRAINDYALGDESVEWYFYTPSGLTSFSPQVWIQRFVILENDTRIIYMEQENNNR
jgi:hypothetical protein